MKGDAIARVRRQQAVARDNQRFVRWSQNANLQRKYWGDPHPECPPAQWSEEAQKPKDGWWKVW